MNVIFVGSNPSHLGPDSPAIRNLNKWRRQLGVEEGSTFVNVSTEVTPGNRPLKKSEYKLDILRGIVRGADKVVALGNTAADALDRLGVQHFKLPHPSPRNRVLNDKDKVTMALVRCSIYLWENE